MNGVHLIRSGPRRFARAVVASAVLAALVPGVPALLVTLAGMPLPRHLASWDQIRAVLERPDDGQVFLAALVVASWLGWAAVALSVLVELLARTRGVAVLRLPALGWSQRLASLLVGAALAGLPAGIAAATPHPGPASPAAAVHRHAPPAAPGHREYRVRPHDSLWRIAERELGDPTRYRDIAVLNTGRTMGDGRRFDPDRFIYPGWILYLPAPDLPNQRPAEVHVVAAGETLSEIAATELGEASRYPEIVRLNEHHPQAGGRALTNPDLIRPGWRLDLPPTSAQAGAPKAAPHPPRPVTAEAPANPIRPAMPAASRPEPPSSPTPVPVRQRQIAPSAPFADLGGVLAAGVVAVLGYRRVIQQRRRRPGERIALPRDSEDAELALHAEQDPGGVTLLDRALRRLANRLSSEGLPLPKLMAARMGVEGVDLLLAEPSELLAPFQPVSELVWRLDTDLLDPCDAGDPAPYPALVTVGRDDTGALWLINLHQLGPITLTGPDDDVLDVLTALALELATSPWAADVPVTCIGFGAELPAMFGPARVRHADSVDETIVDSSGEGRTIVLSSMPCAHTPGDAQIVGMVIGTGDHAPAGPMLDATVGVTGDLGCLPAMVAPQRVTADEYRHILDVLGTATGASRAKLDLEPFPPPDDQPQDPPPEAGSTDPGAPEIRVLGPVEVAGRDVSQIEPGKRNLIPELAAYLKLNPGRGPEAVSRAMGGHRLPWSASTRASNMSRLRAWLGRDPTGRHYLPAQGEGPRYTLLDCVGCDWHRFEEHARRGLAPDATGTADLHAALALVRGQPFSGGGPTGYIWAEYAKQEMISAITDVAHTLAVRLMDAGDPAAARAAIARGLDVEPGSELLYRDLFRAEHQAGNIAGIVEAARRLDAINAELGVGMEPDTADVLTRLLPARRTPAAARR